MKQVLRDKGVAVPDFYPVASAAEVQKIVCHLNRRMVIKPNDNSGARGVQQLTPDSDFIQAFADAARNVKRSGVVLEVFESGPQISTEALICQGEIFLTGFADRNYEYIDRFFPHVLENGATLPSSLPPSQQAEVVDMFFQGIRALGIDNGVAKGDMVYAAGGAKVIEIAGRISGGKFASLIVPESSGVQLLHAALQVAVGQLPDPSYLRTSRCRGVAVRYLFPPAGRLMAVEGVDNARSVPGLLELVVSYQVGDVIGPMRSHPDRGGWVVCVADDRETAVARVEEAISHIRFMTNSD
jgi:biotin carboxylase